MPKDMKSLLVIEINLSEQPMLYVNLSGNLGLPLKDIADNLKR